MHARWSHTSSRKHAPVILLCATNSNPLKYQYPREDSAACLSPAVPGLRSASQLRESCRSLQSLHLVQGTAATGASSQVLVCEGSLSALRGKSPYLATASPAKCRAYQNESLPPTRHPCGPTTIPPLQPEAGACTRLFPLPSSLTFAHLPNHSARQGHQHRPIFGAHLAKES